MNDKKDWTIMVYMSGDNNLSIDMAYCYFLLLLPLIALFIAGCRFSKRKRKS